MSPADPRELAKWINERLDAMPAGAATNLAKLMHKSPDVVSKIRNFRRGVKAHELAIIEGFLDESVPARATKNVGRQGIRVVGYVGASGAEHRYEVEEIDLDQVSPPLGATANTVAVEIRGESLGPAIDRWLAFYDDVRAPITPDLIGHLCVVGLDDGRVLIKKIMRGRQPGTFDLVPTIGETIRSVRISWAARVKSIAPRH